MRSCFPASVFHFIKATISGTHSISQLKKTETNKSMKVFSFAPRWRWHERRKTHWTLKREDKSGEDQGFSTWGSTLLNFLKDKIRVGKKPGFSTLPNLFRFFLNCTIFYELPTLARLTSTIKKWLKKKKFDKIGSSFAWLSSCWYMFESIRLGSMDFELRFKDAIEQMSTRK